jgi:hypothetical protein
MLALIRDTIVTDPGTLTLFSTEDWTPVSYRDSSDAVRKADRYFHDHVSFGHDVETAYLLMEAAEAAGQPNDPATLRVGKRMLDHSLRTGWDAAVGGFHEAGYYFRGQPTLTLVDDTKNWWAQAEGLVSFVGVPLVLDNTPIGVLLCWSRQRRDFQQEEVALAQALGTSAAVGIRNARLHEETELRLRHTETLVSVSQAVGWGRPPNHSAARS